MNCFRRITALFLMAFRACAVLYRVQKEPTTPEEFEMGEADALWCYYEIQQDKLCCACHL